jgi:anti-sigma-K factor RskA
MNCEQADELIGAYAVDALPEREAAEFRAHLVRCERHRAMAAELRAAGSALPDAAEPLPPASALRARILDAVHESPQMLPATRASNVTAAPDRRRARSTPLSPFGRARLAWGAIAAAVVAAIVGLSAWNVVLLNRDDGGAQEFASAITASAPLETAGGERVGTLVYFGDEHRAVLIAEGVQRLDPSRQTYQMWSITGDDATSLGLMRGGDDGRASVAVPFDASKADAFAITVEPAGGSAQPTAAPVYRAEL